MKGNDGGLNKLGDTAVRLYISLSRVMEGLFLWLLPGMECVTSPDEKRRFTQYS